MLIRKGDQGLKIVRLQLQLRSLGLWEQLVDGYFSKKLDVEVRRFQLRAGLYVDGIVGNQTHSKLVKLTYNKWFVLFLHCAASPEGRPHTGEDIIAMHTLPVSKGGRGWSRPGYSDIIELDGTLTNIRDFDQDNEIDVDEYTFGVKFSTLLNRNARHACYIGGVTAEDFSLAKDTRTPSQLETMEIYSKYALLRNPKVIIAGHNQVQHKPCPSFEVPDYLRSIGIKEYNIANWGKMYY